MIWLLVAHRWKAFLIWGVSSPEPRGVTVHVEPFTTSSANTCQIIFQEGTYNIRQVMELTNLKNVSIDIYGKWVWSADNLLYWISNTLPVTYASLYTAL